MATNRILADLFRAIGTQNLNSASAAAMELCKAEEAKGHYTAARQLRGALNGTSGIAAPQGASIVSAALVRVPDPPKLDGVTLPHTARNLLEEVVAEWQHSAQLRARGVAPRSKLLFHGPPGCGKSLTAQALGSALGLPVYIVRFDAVIGAFLGQTAMHLRQLFHFAEVNPCVLLLDELDALGKRRGNPLDVGELDRIVISLLQELEHAQPLGIVVATTNLAAHLDDALWRRFDLDLEFKRPSKVVLSHYVRGLAKRYGIKVDRALLDRAVSAKSFADAERQVIDQVRRNIIKA
jgi:SpoVK/Ycf46/Vps4 family AAA+-type ATPase